MQSDYSKQISVKGMQNVEWKHLSTKPKLRTYVKFKENICTEDYF